MTRALTTLASMPPHRNQRACAVTAAALSGLLLATSPAKADPRLEQAAALVSASMEEHRLFHTCFSLLPTTFGFVAALWERKVEDAIMILEEYEGTAPLIQRLEASLLPGALLPAPQTPFIQLQEECHAVERLEQAAQRYEFIQLRYELEKLLRD